MLVYGHFGPDFCTAVRDSCCTHCYAAEANSGTDIKPSFSHIARSNIWWQLWRTMSLDKAIWTGTWNIQGWLQPSWFRLNPMRCLCWGCQWDLEMGENWCWDCLARSDLCSDSTCVQSCACITGLSLDITVGDNWLYLKPRWTFFKLPHESTIWARETNKKHPTLFAAVLCSCLWKEELCKKQNIFFPNVLKSVWHYFSQMISFLTWSWLPRYSFISLVCSVFVLMVYLWRVEQCL